MKNCTTCQWNSLTGSCKQGHVRWNREKRWVIEECHGWGGKPQRCFCEYPHKQRNTWNVSVQDKEGYPSPVWDITFCPNCGKMMR